MNLTVLRRNIHTLTHHPLIAVSDNLRESSSLVRQLVYGPTKDDLDSNGKRKLLNRGVLDTIDDFVAKRPSGSLKPDYADLWFLYSLITKRRPKVVLEFGSGVSTVVMARAL